jgi:hypothetical protein
MACRYIHGKTFSIRLDDLNMTHLLVVSFKFRNQLYGKDVQSTQSKSRCCCKSFCFLYRVDKNGLEDKKMIARYFEQNILFKIQELLGVSISSRHHA